MPAEAFVGGIVLADEDHITVLASVGRDPFLLHLSADTPTTVMRQSPNSNPKN